MRLLMLRIQEKIKSLDSPLLVKNILAWLETETDPQSIKELSDIIDNTPERLQELFGNILSFGTAGLRSLMGIGTNRMNVFTVRKATQGLAQVLNKTYPQENIRVVVGYDTRHNSLLFAQETARVLAGNKIQALLFKQPQPLGVISFSIRYEHANAGVMITASHNPPAYNGYKVYMHTGGQILPPFDQELMDEFQRVTQVQLAPLTDPLIHRVGEEQESAFLEAISSLQLLPDQNRRLGNMISVTYSPLHGAGASLLPKALKECSFLRVHWVEKQMIPDGSFPTVQFPNPEERESLQLGIEQLLESKDDIFIATDPDVDRLGVVCREGDQPYIFNGNQIACLLLDHIVEAWSQHKTLGKEHKVVKSVVTTEMLRKIATYHGMSLINVGTGFKYIGEKIEELRHSSMEHFVLGAEESYGYLFGNFMEDKDAVSSAVLMVEKALHEKTRGKTLRDRMLELYDTYGYFMNQTKSLSFALNEQEKMQTLLQKLEDMDLKKVCWGGKCVKAFENYQQGVGLQVQEGLTYTLSIPKTRMLCYLLQDDYRVIIRPSGTEPKIKIYFETVQFYASPSQNKEEMQEREEASRERLHGLIQEFEQALLRSV